MYDNLIIGIDGRQGGRDAAALAGQLAGRGARRHLAYVATAPHNGRGSEDDLHLELADPDSSSANLGREECLRLLAAGTVGRVVVLTPAGAPVIRPVNYVFDDASQSVVFRCAEGTKLISLVRAAHAWFEVDEIDPAARTGWSVIIAGIAKAITRAEDVRRLEGLALDSWAAGSAATWFRIRARVVSGRRIGSSVAVTERGE